MLPTSTPAVRNDYVTSIADTKPLIRAAQRLRYRVFAQELGARLDTPVGGHDVDAFDDLAEHLIVTERTTGEVVGTHRLLPPGRPRGSYAETEFDLRGLLPVRSSMIEVGRSCVHPGHRGGAVIGLLWAGTARYALLSGRRYLGGCASVPLDDGGRAASAAWLASATAYMAPGGLRVRPHRPWVPRGPGAAAPGHAALPPRLRGYAHLGARVCGAPAHDPQFGVADFFVLLDMDRLNRRYRRYLLGETR
ncbi:GNAT family N-acetyltransferase [Streptomyces sp. NPDC058195]|uniref:GNAT family N-acetyltransferase n=1 Tax=Streptomyces sp. NPDC058195 TaxID=3346375 RepID=UPI0036EE0DF9